MGAFSLWQWLVVLAVVLILFARPGKISGIMGDFGKGLKNFKKGMKDENTKGDDRLAQDAVYIQDNDISEQKIVRPKATSVKKSSKKKTSKKATKQKTVKRSHLRNKQERNK